jgi:hypothetical protein
MNLRDRLVPNKDEQSYIRFDIEDDNADCEINCTKKELANWVANIVHISVRIMEDNFEEETKKQIISKRMEDLKDLLLNDEE